MPTRMTDDGEPVQTWPWVSMLLIGTFGTQDPASRRYHWRCGIALVGLVVALIALGFISTLGEWSALIWMPAILASVTFGYIAYELWRLVNGLDELSRTVQMEAMAIAYLVGLPIFVTAHVMSSATGWTWQLPAATYLGLDLVRGVVLALRARRYR